MRIDKEGAAKFVIGFLFWLYIVSEYSIPEPYGLLGFLVVGAITPSIFRRAR
jgi:hypothetical protein